jgi:hypothetical protein
MSIFLVICDFYYYFCDSESRMEILTSQINLQYKNYVGFLWKYYF